MNIMIQPQEAESSNANNLIPLGIGGLIVDIGGNVCDLIVIEAASECRHGILAVGHLIDDGGLLEAASKVLLKRFLAQSLAEKKDG